MIKNISRKIDIMHSVMQKKIYKKQHHNKILFLNLHYSHLLTCVWFVFNHLVVWIIQLRYIIYYITLGLVETIHCLCIWSWKVIGTLNYSRPIFIYFFFSISVEWLTSYTFINFNVTHIMVCRPNHNNDNSYHVIKKHV